ncbi:protein-glutamine gamma-glutamyltransferase [Insulibacter thermoxylanivorax]|uniref:Protein-glutamine gamma-glutamyltransferase n=1 Tax=Insulibacter thermoxylanivorax TaxID=2749268 RepID=A0A916QDC2_9BACL|nr:protein-glutamine gamma-glutamyltransferase [Insulibacter thermoxylanivorax]GFR38627.1 protein-glutamine gamma-glutamyltransferase [Insulibacter thermoxylanivorax]
MILIAGSAAPVDTSSWPPLAREIYELKRNSPFVFDYASLHHLRFEMILRAEIVQAARALNDSGMVFATFEEARCNDMYWQLTPLGGCQLKPGISPSVAIRDIFRNGHLYATECATAIPIVYYKAVLEALGDVQFNRLFQNLLLYSWNFDSDLGLIQERTSVERAFPGDVLYFDNPDHHPASPEWQGVNVVMLADDLFYGHGVGIASSREIIRGLNRLRRPFSMISAYLMDLIVYPDFLYLSRFAPSAPLQTRFGPPDRVPWLAAPLQPYSAVIPPNFTANPWLSLPVTSAVHSSPRIRARVGRRRYIC